MKVRDLAEYLQGFDKDEEVLMLPINISEKAAYTAVRVAAMTDTEQPVIFIELGFKEPIEGVLDVTRYRRKRETD